EIDQLRDRLEGKIMVHCPRCPAYMSRPEIVRHLWTEHRLVLVGTAVREPWDLIEQMVEEYQQNQNAELLERCRTLAREADPDDGPRRLQRILLKYRIEDAETARAVLEEAKQLGASVCPQCYGFVFPQDEAQVRSLNVSHG